MPHPLHHHLKQRLYALSPRAFEFFAGDLLAFLGLESVVVTRQSGDGGIDAQCELVSGGVLHVPAGVLMYRRRDSLIGYWELLRQAHHARFDHEAARIAGSSRIRLFGTHHPEVHVNDFHVRIVHMLGPNVKTTNCQN